jgi:D-alanyl-lipoteichoic acid acyltransferase DltB (MBOAT superfamily)
MAILMLGATMIAFLAGLAIGNTGSALNRRTITAASVAAILGVLIFFKTAPLWGSLLEHGFLMPLGLSYYTFKLISYLIDVSWGTRAAETEFIPFAAYAAFFPQIVAGPIQRSDTFLPQIHIAPPVQFSQVVLGLQRIMVGFFKKLVVADSLQLFVNYIDGNMHTGGTPLILSFYIYPLLLYSDFSGLTDIAIGSGLLFGIEAPENFMAPYAAPNISEYWRRWHITLTQWLTDYVFTPTRMATRDFGNAGLVFSLVTNMVLIGLWHRVNWQFALFGVLHATFLSIDALSARSRKRFYKVHMGIGELMKAVGPVFVYHMVAIGCVFFRSESVGDIFYFFRHLGEGIWVRSPEFTAFIDSNGRKLATGLVGYGLIEVADYFRRHNQKNELTGALPKWGRWSVYSCTAVTAMLLVLLLLAFGSANRNPFLYAIF